MYSSEEMDFPLAFISVVKGKVTKLTLTVFEKKNYEALDLMISDVTNHVKKHQLLGSLWLTLNSSFCMNSILLNLDLLINLFFL